MSRTPENYEIGNIRVVDMLDGSFHASPKQRPSNFCGSYIQITKKEAAAYGVIGTLERLAIKSAQGGRYARAKALLDSNNVIQQL